MNRCSPSLDDTAGRFVRSALLIVLAAGIGPRAGASPPTEPSLKELRRRFQDQELTTGRPFSLLLNQPPPRIIGRGVG